MSFRNGSAAAWTAAYPVVLDLCEVGIVNDAADGEPNAKLGDGVTEFGSLPWWEPGGASGDVLGEEARATTAEATLTTALADEVTRAEGAESTLTTDLADEVARASGAETTLGLVLGTYPFKTGELVTNGETLYPRYGTAESSSGFLTERLALTYFIPQRTESVTEVIISGGAIVASGLTFAKIGVFSEATNGDLALVGVTADLHTSLFSSAYGTYTESFTSGFTKTAGQRYALGVLLIGTTMPNFYGASCGYQGAAPKVSGYVDSETTMPTSITNGSINVGTFMVNAILGH
jgi:hypothetical protein